MILTESQLKAVITEATKRVINEIYGDMLAASFADPDGESAISGEDLEDGSFSKKSIDSVKGDEDNEFIARMKQLLADGAISQEEYQRIVSSC